MTGVSGSVGVLGSDASGSDGVLGAVSVGGVEGCGVGVEPPPDEPPLLEAGAVVCDTLSSSTVA